MHHIPFRRTTFPIHRNSSKNSQQTLIFQQHQPQQTACYRLVSVRIAVAPAVVLFIIIILFFFLFLSYRDSTILTMSSEHNIIVENPRIQQQQQQQQEKEKGGKYAHFTNGAFLHLGKTGGSTLSTLLRNACHSWMTKPCVSFHPNISTPSNVRESAASQKIQAYFHTPDFLKLPQSPLVDFYVVSVRDPYDRIRSAFVYGHPANAKKSNTRCIF